MQAPMEQTFTSIGQAVSRLSGRSSAQPGAGLRITREGWLWLLAAAILWGTGLYKSMNLITFLGTLMVAVLGLNLLLVCRGLLGLYVRRRIEGPLFARVPFVVDVAVENRRRIRRIGVRLEDRGPDHLLAWFLMELPGGDKQAFRQVITLPRRGWYTGGVLRLSTGYPFGLAECSWGLSTARRMLVFPALGNLHRGRLRQFLAHVAPSPGQARGRPCRHPTAQSEFYGLRAFRTGDSPRLIHWRTSARRGELMIREFEDTPTDNLILVMDPWLAPATMHEDRSAKAVADPAMPPRAPPRALLEEAISLAATICWEWCRQKGDRFVLAVAGAVPIVLGGVTGRDHALLLLECLALLEGEAAPHTDALLDRLADTPLPPGPILAVSPYPSALGASLAQRLHRPVASLDVFTSSGYDFFERDPGDAT